MCKVNYFESTERLVVISSFLRELFAKKKTQGGCINPPPPEPARVQTNMFV